jgi:hypothetical protein
MSNVFSISEIEFPPDNLTVIMYAVYACNNIYLTLLTGHSGFMK